MDARAAAAQALVEVLDAGHSLSSALPVILQEIGDPRERARAQDLCYGVLRWLPRLESIAGQLMHKPLRRRDIDIYCIILTGLYQMVYTRIPAHAAVAETVNLAAKAGKPWVRDMVNAVLRRYQREGTGILARADLDETSALAHPAWLLETFKAAWPEDWQGIARANNERAPMCLRVNLSRGRREDYLKELAAAGIAAVAAHHVASAVVLEQAIDVARLPGFSDGRVSVQDAAAQIAAELLDAQGGERVLDACAAPGGKTSHILERQPAPETLVAVDRDAARLRRVAENLARLGLRADMVCADASEPGSWWDGRAFDRILLDAPCSGTGVIRRHPDIKCLRRHEDIATLVNQQLRLLEAAWHMLRRGGMLLYSTCSILHEENDILIGQFLASHPDARARPMEAQWGRPLSVGRQILPGEDGMDGFYYASLDKLTDK